MTPRTIMVPEGHPLYRIQPHAEWGALLLARMHKVEEESAGGAWSCPCRCCRWAREQQTRFRGQIQPQRGIDRESGLVNGETARQA
jgi:hypothetical protein